MKTQLRFLMFLAAFCLVFACSKTYDDPRPDPTPTLAETVTLPFGAIFKGAALPFNQNGTLGGGTGISKQNTGNCGDGYKTLAESGNGTAAYSGKITFSSVFCLSNGDILPTSSYFQAADGSILNVAYSGKTCGGCCTDNVHPSTEICCWMINFTILGGTGKFEGATGSGSTNDYIDKVFEEGYNSHHSWKGTITIPRKNLAQFNDQDLEQTE
jgi:hypothetical protein